MIFDSCCDRCMMILMIRGMCSDFFFSRCKILIYFKSKSVKRKKKNGNRFLVKKEIIDLYVFFLDCIVWCFCFILLRLLFIFEVFWSFIRVNEIVM